jgi:hypothetical protein
MCVYTGDEIQNQRAYQIYQANNSSIASTFQNSLFLHVQIFPLVMSNDFSSQDRSEFQGEE